MAYVAPTWRNGGPPALDASALQAISDAIVANQTKNTQQDSSISSLQTAVNGKSRVAIGSYTGTGNYGASNPNSITFPFTPKLVWIYMITGNKNWTNLRSVPVVGNYDGYKLMVRFDTLPTSYTQQEENTLIMPFSNNIDVILKYIYIRKNGNTLSWYYNASDSYSAITQLNASGTMYHWVAFS